MSYASSKRPRGERVSRNVAPRSGVARWLVWLRDPDILRRVGIGFMAALVMWVFAGAWRPSFPFRTGYVPPRDIVAHTPFSRPDEKETEARRRMIRSETPVVYQHDVQPLIELRKALKNHVFQVIRTESISSADPQVWQQFQPSPRTNDPMSPAAARGFEELRAALSEDTELVRFEKAVQSAVSDYERDGLLENLVHELGEGSQTTLLVHPVGKETAMRRLDVKDVRIAEAAADLRDRLTAGFTAEKFPPDKIPFMVELVENWLRNKKFPATLTLNQTASQRVLEEAKNAVETVMVTYNVGDKLAAGNLPLREEDVALLRLEYQASLNNLTLSGMLTHSLADLGMFIALFVVCGSYIYYHERRILTDLRRFVTLLGVVVVTLGLCIIASREAWRAEIIPLSLFAMTLCIAYHRELALMASAAVALVLVMSLGQRLPELVVLVASAVGPVLFLTRIRNRTKLIYVGLWSSAVTLLTALGVGTLTGQSFGSPDATFPWVTEFTPDSHPSFFLLLLSGSAWFGFCSLLSGLLMTGLLPFIEKLFDVQTDLSLLELGDASHPLLQELARRAPGTYNHSINVASLAEVAAESIGANGLLTRVGAYFHDIGKMVKPGYFVENQAHAPNRHGSLLPAMSTLVIIAHVKDGAELARRHHLPRSIIDFIEQHHGTTLVEYFYDQAAKMSAVDPHRGEVDETSFRYPGPKPQTKEAAVMMVADCVESASRALVDPTPARIEGLVQDLARKRLLDGQFDECGLTLRELSIIEDTLVKSLTAVYHGRVKYPDQQTA